ncbi:DMT family transporter [Amphritea sp. HPY]|uniref:DMT family transporter n=1 Tax=Amphritea sp. HPY TaxID=3421652 RepID=UPI003D7C623E
MSLSLSLKLSPQSQGIAYGLLAALIWSGHSIASTLGLNAGLSAYDLTALRILTNIVIFLPVILLSKPSQKAGLTLTRGIILALCAGASFSVVITSALVFAPVTHSAAISLGTVPLFAFLLMVILGRSRLQLNFVLALLLLCGGIILTTVASSQPGLSPQYWIGDLLFLSGAIMWASYAVLGRIWNINALLGVAATNYFSAPYLVVYFWQLEPGLNKVSILQLLFQVLYQGVLVGGVALICYIRSTALLGVEKGALFTALAPVGVMLLGSTVLQYQPVTEEIVGMILVTVGMAIALLQRPT